MRIESHFSNYQEGDQAFESKSNEPLSRQTHGQILAQCVKLTTGPGSKHFKAEDGAFEQAQKEGIIEPDQRVGRHFRAPIAIQSNSFDLDVEAATLGESYAISDVLDDGERRIAEVRLEYGSHTPSPWMFDSRGLIDLLVAITDKGTVKFFSTYSTRPDPDPTFNQELQSMIDQWGIPFKLSNDNNQTKGTLNDGQGKVFLEELKKIN